MGQQATTRTLLEYPWSQLCIKTPQSHRFRWYFDHQRRISLPPNAHVVVAGAGHFSRDLQHLETGLSKDACQGRPVDKLVVFSTSGPYCRCKMIQAMTDSPPFRQWFTACEIYFGFGDSNGNISRMSILGEFCIQLSHVSMIGCHIELNWTETCACLAGNQTLWCLVQGKHPHVAL